MPVKDKRNRNFRHPRKRNRYGKNIRYKKTLLENGVRILTEEVPMADSFALGITVNAGSGEDYPGREGLAHFMEHALFLRTGKRNSRQIATHLESLGAYANAFTTKEQTCFYVRALNDNFSKVLEILSDLALNPKFVDKEIEKERQIIIEEIRSYDDDPEELIMDYADRLLFGNHGLGHPIVGDVNSVLNIGTDDIISFHERNYSPQNIMITAAGSLEHELITGESAEYFSKMTKGNDNINRIAPPLSSPVRKEYKKPFTQTHIMLCRQAEGINSPDRYPLALLNIIMGDGMSSRLYLKLREKHGYAYNVYSSLQQMLNAGGIYIYAAIDDRNINKTEKYIFDEFEKLIEKRIPSTEIRRAKEQIKSNTIMALESMYTRMTSLAKSEFSTGDYEDIESTIDAVESVTADDIKRVAAKYFKPVDWSVITFLPE